MTECDYITILIFVYAYLYSVIIFGFHPDLPLKVCLFEPVVVSIDCPHDAWPWLLKCNITFSLTLHFLYTIEFP